MVRTLQTDLRTSTLFEFHALQSLPCGCVAADYRARMLAVDLVALEAKGPHCTIPAHRTGGILSLEDAGDDSEHQDYAEGYRL